MAARVELPPPGVVPDSQCVRRVFNVARDTKLQETARSRSPLIPNFDDAVLVELRQYTQSLRWPLSPQSSILSFGGEESGMIGRIKHVFVIQRSSLSSPYSTLLNLNSIS